MTRHVFKSSASLAGFALMGFVVTISLDAAPPKSSPGSESKSAVVESMIEVPAVPYLTLTLARDPAVHAELKLTTQQIEKTKSLISEVDETFWQLRDVPVQKCASNLETLRTKLVNGLKRELTASQFDRFHEIVLQGRSWKALISPEVSVQLKLSTDQVTRLRTALNDAVKEREPIEKELASKPASVQEQSRTKLRESEGRRFSAVLTTDQQTAFRKLLGQPFDFSRVTQVGCLAPELRQVTAWINSDPITLSQLRGQVVVLHFWAFGCINCVRNLPHYQTWHEKFGEKGVTIIGVHTPETDTERQIGNLRLNVQERNIRYPVVVDGNSGNWNAWGNNTWPSVYLIDKQGRVRNWWYGELNWNGAKGEEFFRRRIEELLMEK